MAPAQSTTIEPAPADELESESGDLEISLPGDEPMVAIPRPDPDEVHAAASSTRFTPVASELLVRPLEVYVTEPLF